MNKRLCLAASLTTLATVMLCVSFSFGRGRLEEAAYQRAKKCNDAYWACMGKCQDAPFFKGLCESNCLNDLKACRAKANLPRTTDVGTESPPHGSPGTSATPKRPIDTTKVSGATVTASASPSRRTQGLDERLKTLKTSPTPTPTKASPTPKKTNR